MHACSMLVVKCQPLICGYFVLLLVCRSTWQSFKNDSKSDRIIKDKVCVCRS